MADRISATEFQQSGPPEWQVTDERAEATFLAPSFERAGAFVHQVASAADAADHHPDVELRYPGRVHISLTTHSAGGLTHRDVELARTLSELAAASGLSATG